MAKGITEEIILQATAYIPIEKKAFLAREYAKSCISKVELKVDDGEQALVLPNKWQENPKNKSLYGLMTLLDEYLHILDEQDGAVSFSSEDYDDWGGMSIMNQLDRMKSSKNLDVRNKVYDILDDYRDWYRMLGVEIASLLAARNDSLLRFVEYFQFAITPDLLKGAFEQLSDKAAEFIEQEEKDKINASDGVTEGV